MSDTSTSARSGDRLMWVLAGGVGLLAMLTVVILNVGTSTNSPAPTNSETEEVATAVLPPDPGQLPTQQNALDRRLNRAQLAFNAGMLIEPEGFSAWSIYREILAENSSDARALEGLTAVASGIVDAAWDALNAGDRDTANALAQRVLDQIPDHADAQAVLASRNNRQQIAAPDPIAVPERPTVNPEPAVTIARPRAEPARQPVAVTLTATDPIAEIYPKFTQALADGNLTASAPDNATEFLTAMRVLNTDHAMTKDAEQQLLESILLRFLAAFDALEISAAHEWLDAAERLNVDNERVRTERAELSAFVAAVEAQDLIAASDLTTRNYVAPTYPEFALRRELQGWVDLNFLVDKNGVPRDIEVVDASNTTAFRTEAINAVEQWRFEPHEIMNRVVEQKVHTRIRFVMER